MASWCRLMRELLQSFIRTGGLVAVSSAKPVSYDESEMAIRAAMDCMSAWLTDTLKPIFRPELAERS